MEILEAVKIWLLWLWSQWQTQFLVGHICVNAIVAAAVSIWTNDFILAKLPEFLYRKILPLTLIYGAFAFVGETIHQPDVGTAAWGLLTLLLASDMLDNLAKIGLKVPASLTKARL